MGEGETVVLRRYLQYALDQVTVMVATASATLWGAAAAYALVVKVGAPGEVLYLPLVMLVVVALGGTLWSEVWVPHTQGGATPAMRRLGLRIVRLDGTAPTLRDYLVRWLLFAVDGLFLGLLGAVLIAVTPRHQRFGDIVTRTVVVRVRSSGGT
ncbi:RDD family protein [Umezawaea endophytica]|uniref:RDD family protein n=1 Tax=Umezawaea endophytica TaxID=1654476 RepID=A0A9X2VFR9_9PSEU|nr:RDD family protein [Umezawaea endophytica]MCS7475760.1 RDD family protein [Umezawaea endophytica]